MPRTDFWDDPHAPAINSLVAAASAVVEDTSGRIVLHRRRDNGRWALPGGAMELGESVDVAVRREVAEETGLVVEPLYVIGVYSDPRHVFAYTDGEVRQEFSVCLACRIVGGDLAVSDESFEVRAYSPSDLERLDIHERIRLRIADYLSGARGAIR